MFVKKRIRWAFKTKNRMRQRPITRRRKRSCGQLSEIKDESVATNEENGGIILKQTNYGKLFQATISQLEDYCSHSTLHGVKYFVDKNRHWLERFWWMAGFVVSIVCCGVLIHRVYDNWNQRAIIVSISEELRPVWDIPLPAITVCPASKIQSKQFNVTEFHKRLRDNPEILLNITDEEVKILLAYNMICDPSRDLVNISDKFSQSSVIDVVWKFAPTSNYTIRYCNLPDSVCKLEEIMTEMGLCFTFNMLNRKETYSIESAAYSQIDHNKAAQWNLENGYDPNISKNSIAYPYRMSFGNYLVLLLRQSAEHYEGCGQASYHVALHLPGEIPQRYQFNLLLSTFEDAYVILKPKVIITTEALRPYHPDRRKCYFNADRKLRFLKVYTQRNCELECLSNFTLSLCGCVPHFLLRDANTPICGPAKFDCFNSARKKLLNGQVKRELTITEEEYYRLSKLVENCNCLPTCNSIKYEAEIIRHAGQRDAEQSSFLRIKFEENEFMALTRSEVYGTLDFIANCGGLLGLFVGASFLSVVEMLYYCSLRLYCTRLNRKRNNKIYISTA